MKLREKDISILAKTIERKKGYIINKESFRLDLSPARLYLAIKEEIKLNTENLQTVYPVSITLFESVINYTNNTKPDSTFVGLKEYSRETNVRASVIKKILTANNYLRDQCYPTDKSYRLGCVFTTFHQYKSTAMNTRIPEILTLWKVSFLENILVRHREELKVLSEMFSYSKPRSKNECLNQIRIHSEFIGNPENTESQFYQERTKILERYKRFYTKHYSIDDI